MKFYSIVALIALFTIVGVVWGTVLLTERDTEEKIVYVEKPLKGSTIEELLLGFGVTDAWEELYGANIKADCFTTELVNFQYVYSMCKLRRPLK